MPQGAEAVAERLLDGLSALTLLSCLIIAAVLLLWFLLAEKSRYPRRRAFVTAQAGRWASAPRRGQLLVLVSLVLALLPESWMEEYGKPCA